MGKLSNYEAVTLNSFVKKGFHVKLWTYENSFVLNSKLNSNVELQDASAILEKKMIKLFTQNSQKSNLSSFTNLFRYKLLSQHEGWWFDTDCVCLKNVEHFENLAKNAPFVLGREPSELVNGSVMFFNDTNHIKNLIKIVEEKLNKKDINFYWGEIGPYLLTDYFSKSKYEKYILTKNLFYEISAKDFHLLFSTNKKSVNILEKRLESSFVCHFWNEMFRRHNINKDKIPPIGSIFYKFFEDDLNLDLDKKKYSTLVNIRFKKPYNYFFKAIYRVKIMLKNLKTDI